MTRTFTDERKISVPITLKATAKINGENKIITLGRSSEQMVRVEFYDLGFGFVYNKKVAKFNYWAEDFECFKFG